MVSITKIKDTFEFKILGMHKFWALKSKIIINQNQIINVFQDKKELQKYKGWRLGTHIPYIITAGKFTRKGISNFWDVCKEKDTIIVELKNHQYNKLYIQVENPIEMISFLKNKLNS